MKILFAMSSPEYLRHYDDTIRQLAARGHHVAIAVSFVRDDKPGRLNAIGQAHPRISIAGLVPPRDDRWTALTRAIRGTMDFVRYWHPELAPAAALRARVKRQALPWVLQWMDRTHSRDASSVARLMNRLVEIDRVIPPSRALVRFVDSLAPDVVLVSPLVEPVSEQVDLVRAAQARGTRVATLVASWDNLTNKGDLHVPTQAVVVWNEAQKREAVEFHRVPADRIVVTGAQTFDRWFDREPSRTREQFCCDVGLPADRPFVLFTGSSIFIARAEAEIPFIRQWIEALRGSDDASVRNLSVLVRPHPYNGSAWKDDALADLPGVAVWPRGGYDPADERHRAGLFDSLHHSEAVVGINTSAMIEAAIVGRPVFSVAAPQFAGSQEGTLHYRHLLPENGGFLRVASTLEEHVRQLGAVLRDPARARDELTRFVKSFIRPQGIDTASTPLLVETIERIGASPAPAPLTSTVGDRVLRLGLWPFAYLARLFPPPAERKRRTRSSRPKTPARVQPAAAPSSVAAGRLPLALVMCLVAPMLAATALLGVFVVGEMLGRAPFADQPPRNMAEAAGLGIGSEVLRFLRQGEDPARVVEVRPDIISSEITRVTALEAAIWSRSVELIRLLDRHRVIDEEGTRRHLTCLASDIAAAELLQYFAPKERDGGEAAAQEAGCAPGETARMIQDRSL